MDIWSTDSLLLFLFFVVPGFVCLKTYHALIPNSAKDASQQIIDAVAFSCVNYALLSLPIFFVEEAKLRQSSPVLYFGFWTAVLLVAPALWAVAFWALRRLRLIQRILPHPTEAAWDYVFSLPRHVWVVVTLNDGQKIGGFFGPNSFASSAPCDEQLYLEMCWHLNDDGGFERPRTDTAGVLILQHNISALEFFHVTRGNHDEPRKEACTNAGPTGIPAISATQHDRAPAANGAPTSAVRRTG